MIKNGINVESKREKEKGDKREKYKRSLSEIFSLNKISTNTKDKKYLSFNHISDNSSSKVEMMQLKLKQLEIKTKKLEKINSIFYDMIQKQNIEINNQSNLNELERLNQKFSLNNNKNQYYNNPNLPLISSYNDYNKSRDRQFYFYEPPPFNYSYPQALPYINEMERIIKKYKKENDDYRDRRNQENFYMRRIDEKINDFLMEETLKKNDNTFLRNQLKEMNDQLNYRLESIERNQRSQKQKIDYIMQNYFMNEKNKYKSNYKYKKHKDSEQTINVNKSSINISPSYRNDSNENDRIYPYENSKRIYYKKKTNSVDKIENGGNSNIEKEYINRRLSAKKSTYSKK
jgi:hypothetical protein